MKLNDIKRSSIHEAGACIRPRRAGESCGIGPNGSFEIILRVLASSGKRIDTLTMTLFDPDYADCVEVK